MMMNRRQKRIQARQERSAAPGFTRQQLTNAGRIARQAYIWRYMEDGWDDLKEGYGFRGTVKLEHRHQYYNLALALPMRWQAVTIIYMRDNWGKEYREFGFARTSQAFKGIGDGITPLINLIAAEAEANLNPKHIYGRAVLFSPYSEEFNSLVPILQREMESLKLKPSDIIAVEQEEAYTKRSLTLPADKVNIDDEIANLMA